METAILDICKWGWKNGASASVHLLNDLYYPKLHSCQWKHLYYEVQVPLYALRQSGPMSQCWSPFWYAANNKLHQIPSFGTSMPLRNLKSCRLRSVFRLWPWHQRPWMCLHCHFVYIKIDAGWKVKMADTCLCFQRPCALVFSTDVCVTMQSTWLTRANARLSALLYNVISD